ncbi:MAG: permease prefix domain 1-containing protein [Bacteroidota bacterium]
MSTSESTASLEEQINQWRNYLLRRQAIHSVDVAELEDHLREQVNVLIEAGLSSDEAFLVAVKRMGALDALSREFAREHSDRLWKQLVVLPDDTGDRKEWVRGDAFAAVGFAVLAGMMVKVPALFGIHMHENDMFYARNMSLFVLPLLTVYFVLKRGLGVRSLLIPAAGFAAAFLFANIFPFTPQGYTELLTVLHLPVALWFIVGAAYAGERWREIAGRMDFIRFSGELFIYYVLIALGGGVFTAFLVMLFESIGIKPEWFIQNWLIPCSAAGAVIVASWLVEAKQSVIENMAPVLTRLFTPFFALLLVIFLATLVVSGRGINIEREILIAFDMLLIVVLGLLLYSISARDPHRQPGFFDLLQVVLVVSALLADAVALWAISARITEYGFTPNRVAMFGVNIILLINLTWSAVLYLRFLKNRTGFSDLEQWQTNYLPVYMVWAAIVVIIFPPLFGYM